MISLTLPLHLVNPLNQSHGHWTRKAARARVQRGTARLAVQAELSKQPTPLPVVVTITRVSAGTLDFDGLVASAKHVRDAVADAYAMDDRTPLIEWRYEQRKGRRGAYEVEIRIEQQGAAS